MQAVLPWICSSGECGRAASRDGAGGRRRSRGEDAEDVLLLHDEELLTVHLDFASGVFAEEDAIPRLDVERGLLARFGHPALADRDDLALLGLLLRAVRDDDGAAAGRLVLDPPDEDSIVQ